MPFVMWRSHPAVAPPLRPPHVALTATPRPVAASRGADGHAPALSPSHVALAATPPPAAFQLA